MYIRISNSLRILCYKFLPCVVQPSTTTIILGATMTCSIKGVTIYFISTKLLCVQLLSELRVRLKPKVWPKFDLEIISKCWNLTWFFYFSALCMCFKKMRLLEIIIWLKKMNQIKKPHLLCWEFECLRKISIVTFTAVSLFTKPFWCVQLL